MHCDACSHSVDLKEIDKRLWCRQFGVCVILGSTDYVIKWKPDEHDCQEFTTEISNEEPLFDLFP